MKASEPRDLPGLFLQALNSGDVDSVVALYEPDGVVAPDPARLVAGQAAIESMVTEFLAQGPRFVLHDSEVVQASGIALVRSRWTVNTVDSGGTSAENDIAPTLVARQQPDGHWLVVIDRPLPETG